MIKIDWILAYIRMQNSNWSNDGKFVKYLIKISTTRTCSQKEFNNDNKAALS